MNYINVKRHSYDFGDGEIYFRSTWEINYAFYLEWEKKNGEVIKWEYEPERYRFWRTEGNTKFEMGSYLPDFRVIYKDGTVRLKEIKGREQGMSKIKKMKRHYPELPVDLIGKDEYNTLKRQLGKMLNFY